MDRSEIVAQVALLRAQGEVAVESARQQTESAYQAMLAAAERGDQAAARDAQSQADTAIATAREIADARRALMEELRAKRHYRRPYLRCSVCGRVRRADEMNTIVSKRRRERPICGRCIARLG